MIVSRILAAGLLALSTLGAPSPVPQEGTPQAVGRWAITASLWGNSTRSCRYGLTICDDNGSDPPSWCTNWMLTIVVSEPLPSDGPGYDRTFELSRIQENDSRIQDNDSRIQDNDSRIQDNDPRFQVLWMQDTRHSVSITVLDTQQKAWARFNTGVFSGDWLPASWNQTANAFPYLKPGNASHVDPNLLVDGYDDLGNASAPLKIRDEDESDEDDFWQIQGMNRDYRAASHLTYLDFTIVLTDGKRENCHLIVPETEPDSSFYAVPCGVSGYTVSWGYKADTDGGVMTICNPALHKNAWFGWDGIGRRSYLGDSPRNVARTVDCE